MCCTKTKFKFMGRSGDIYYWESTTHLAGGSRVEQIRCNVNWFWTRPRKCIGYDDNANAKRFDCPNIPTQPTDFPLVGGGVAGPVWCDECDRRRRRLSGG
jgi:hypothetical protein